MSPHTTDAWLRVLGQMQHQIAEAHSAYLRCTGESHGAFLRTAEASLSGLAHLANGAVRLDRPVRHSAAEDTPALDGTGEAHPAAQPPQTMAPAPALSPVYEGADADEAPPPPPAAPSRDADSADAAPTPSEAPATSTSAETTPADTAPAAADAPTEAQSVDPRDVLMSVVSERTGYPVEMLDTSMDLKTDLGVDSIKLVQIFSRLDERLSDSLPEPLQQGELTGLRTLGEVAGKLQAKAQGGTAASTSSDSAQGGAAAGTSSDSAEGGAAGGTSGGPAEGARDGDRDAPAERAQPPPEPTRAPAPAAADSHALSRFVARTVPRPPSGLALAGLGTGPLLVTDGSPGVADLVARMLTEHGVHAVTGSSVPDDTRGAIFLGGLQQAASADEALTIQHRAFSLARELAPRLGSEGGVFVTVQDTDGDFGLSGTEPRRAWLGGLAALARTAAREWPRASVKAIDCAQAGRSATDTARAVVEELLTGGPAPDVGLRADGTRVCPDVVASALEASSARRVGPDSVIVATGGARGITAAALRALASAHRPRLALIGRTPLVDEPPGLERARDEQAITRVLAEQAAQQSGRPPAPADVAGQAREIVAVREIGRTLEDLAQAGAEVRYLTADVTRPDELDRALATTRHEWGPITGVIHGAGVLEDRHIADKTDEQFRRVFSTKVQGLRALLAATADDPLRVLCVFSSVVARFGNSGQCDYAMANEVLNQVASAEQVRRADCSVRAIAWGPWRGGLVDPSLEQHFRERGVPLIPPDAGADAFVAELNGAPAETGTQTVLAASDDPGRLDSAPAAPFRAEARLGGGEADAYLTDHAIADTPVLPMAMALEWFIAACEEETLGQDHVVREVQVLRRVSLPGLPRTTYRFLVEATADDGDGPGLRLTDQDGTPCYQARSGRSLQHAVPEWSLPGDLEPPADTDIYDGHALFHGPGFHSLRAVHGTGESGAVATVVGTRQLEWPRTRWRTDPAAVDGALQLAVLWARPLLRGASLPIGAAEVRVNRCGPLEHSAQCVVQARQVSGAQAECDVALVDGRGRPRVELLGLTLLRRPDDGQEAEE